MDLKACKVLVTPTSFGKNDPNLKKQLEDQVGKVIYNKSGKPLKSFQLQSLLPGVHGYIAGLDEIDEQALAAADELQVICRYGVGFDNVDLQAAFRKGIVVTNTPGANSVSVAELALGMMLSLARHIPAAVEATRRGEWPRISGTSLDRKVVGIVGLGAIGKAFVVRLSGFNCRILAYDPYPDFTFAEAQKITLVSLEEVLTHSDFLSLHLPLLPATHGMVNKEFIQKMKAGAYLINTSRGEIINEADLLSALQSGHLAGAALDAFSTEPPEPNNLLLKLPQVLVTPHMGAHADSATNAMGRMALEDCLAVLSGCAPRYRIVIS
jgi:phosphoglycerate dehydrogenase-like enzyme